MNWITNMNRCTGPTPAPTGYDYAILDCADLKIRIKRMPRITKMITHGRWVYLWFKKEPEQGKLI